MERHLEQPIESTAAVAPKVVIRRPERFRLLRKSPSAIIGTAILAFWLIVAIFGPNIAPYGTNDTESGAVWKAPSAAHLMGTDALGRDIFSRLIIAAQPMMVLPPLAVGTAVLLGCAIGFSTGYRGGWTDEIVMRCMDVLMAF